MKFKKSIVLLMAVTMLGGTTLPSVSVFANEKELNYSELLTEDDLLTSLYNNLSLEKQKEFDLLTTDGNFSEQDKIDILKEKYNNNSEGTAKWKVAILKKAVKYVAKLVGAKLSAKTLTDFVNYLTGFEDNVQTGLEKGLVKYLHVNKAVAKWAAKTAMFIFF